MLTPPEDLSEAAVVSALRAGWNFTTTSIEYRAVGFGSHHWDAVDIRGERRFVTVDDLAPKGNTIDEDKDLAFVRLGAALATARDLCDAGCEVVVARLPTASGIPLLRIDQRYAVALYPYVIDEHRRWDERSAAAHRERVLEMVVTLHSVPTTVAPHAAIDEFTIPHRDELELSLHDNRGIESAGPFADRTSALLGDHAESLRQSLRQFDTLVAETLGRSTPTVLTHGEPHPGNTMLTAAGWKLVDWDTVLIAPPERDLWSLDPGDGSVFGAYEDATHTTLRPSTLDLYRVRWDLADIAAYVNRFRAPHSATADDEKSWVELRDLVTRLGRYVP